MVSGEQQLQCPICQQVMTLRGLHGHLRIKHNKAKEDVMNLIGQAPVDPDEKTEEILNLLEMLKHLKEQHVGINVLKTRGCFEHEEVEVQVMSSLQREAGVIVDRLTELGVTLDEADIMAYCMTLKRQTRSSIEI